MYDRKKRISLRTPLLILICVVSFFFDIVFGTERVPVLTIIVCGIVVVYECISPFIYSSR